MGNDEKEQYKSFMAEVDAQRDSYEVMSYHEHLDRYLSVGRFPAPLLLYKDYSSDAGFDELKEMLSKYLDIWKYILQYLQDDERLKFWGAAYDKLTKLKGIQSNTASKRKVSEFLEILSGLDPNKSLEGGKPKMSQKAFALITRIEESLLSDSKRRFPDSTGEKVLAIKKYGLEYGYKNLYPEYMKVSETKPEISVKAMKEAYVYFKEKGDTRYVNSLVAIIKHPNQQKQETKEELDRLLERDFPNKI